ncbi:septum formation inhibitor Maf [Algibacter aquimarinus]|uniref:Septum formation inhibitor Maf n=1 Tax=Algibacter aquimarinus TaxID=1136748 RepID=A0ABP9HSB7_9FLAO
METYIKFKKIIKAEILFWLAIVVIALVTSCKNKVKTDDLAVKTDNVIAEVSIKQPTKTTPEFKAYWYAGEAEISSYKLEQARYGEMREGTAVLVYVTEDFLPEIQVKADYQNPENIPVLKLNATKKFNTGIYPYSIMQSTFYPVSNNQHAIKVSSSIQEWCGHVYAQLNNREQFEIMSHSYFEREADERFKIDKTILENELWTKLRINPELLPTGNLQIVPSLEYTRLRHKTIKAYKATATLNTGVYTINYPSLNRTLTIHFNSNFPHDILSWEETIGNQTTKATKLKTIKSPYWNKNSNKDQVLRDTLQLN